MASLPATQAEGHPPALTVEGETFALRQRQARMFAMSPLVPDHLRKGAPEQALANCYIALTLAEAMGEVPLIVMQNIHVVHGVAGFKTEYKIARANHSGIFKGRINWRVDRSNKDNLSVTAFAVLAETGEEVEFTCDMAMAKAEGWTKNSKYQTMPEVMLRYRSASFLIRFYAGDVMLGYQTVDEIEDIAAGGGLADTIENKTLTADMLVQQAEGAVVIEGDMQEVVDAETGEVLDANDGTLSDDNPTAAEGPDESQRGEREPEAQQESTMPKWIEDEQRIVDALSTATAKSQVDGAERDFLNIAATFPDDVRQRLDGDIRTARKRVAAKAMA